MAKGRKEDPWQRRWANEAAKAEVIQELEERGLKHLHVLTRGQHVVIYSEEDGEKAPRVRFSRIDRETYELGVMSHTGRWDITPFTGNIKELIETVTNQFGFLLLSEY